MQQLLDEANKKLGFPYAIKRGVHFINIGDVIYESEYIVMEMKNDKILHTHLMSGSRLIKNIQKICNA